MNIEDFEFIFGFQSHFVEVVEVRAEAVVSLDSQGLSYLILLTDMEADRGFSVEARSFQATYINSVLQNKKRNRSFTYDLFKKILEYTEAEMESVVIDKIQNLTYHSKIYFNKKLFSVEARPSDAIALALCHKKPIFVNKKTFDLVAIKTGMDADKNFNFSELKDWNKFFCEDIEALTLSSIDKNDLEYILKKAVDLEHYEQAATLRDIISTKY